jgi:jacalin-like lectin domain-containing protein
MLAVDTQSLFSAPQETASIGNKAAGKSEVVLTSDKAVATFIGVRWDGDKVRGIRMELSDGSFKQAGGYDDAKYTLTSYRFTPGETLVTATLRDSGYGYGSLRQVEFETSLNKTFNAGAGGFDNEESLAVEGAELVGFHAWVNPDNFINALAFIVRLPPPKPIVHRPWFATRSVGNQAAAGSEVDLWSETSVARVISVRWDGDKVRGVRMELRDGTIKSAGGIDDVKYALSSYTFAEGETLKSLSFSSSGYGYGSLRRLEFTTSKGVTFTAGPTGIDDIVTPPISGAEFVGFHAWVNPDNFINAITFHATNDAPFTVNLLNYSPWACAYADGVVTIDGKNAIRVIDQGGNKHGMNTSHNRVVQIQSGAEISGYCAFDGAAPLMISVFGDATFEAKFSVDDGDGSVYGPIAGIKPPADKWALMDALVHKYAPIYMLNVDEVYWQSTIDAFLPHMILQKAANSSGQGLSTFYDGPMDRNILAKQASLLGAANTNTMAFLRTRADLNQPSDTQDWFASAPPTKPSQVTAYAVVVEGAQKRLDIVYWWFFNYNQGKTVAGTSWGNHVSDWEHVRVKLDGVDFANPQNEVVVGVMYDHHGDQDNFMFGDGKTEFSGRQVLVHLANGDHEAYAKAGVYDRPENTHDYCKENAYRFDQRQGTVEIYLWSGSEFSPMPAGATPNFRDSAWLKYRGRWGNQQRGDLFGLVARLESGPEGLFRASEYPPPLPLS